MPLRGNKRAANTNTLAAGSNPQKGCANCERRRIRCDLKRPTCHKCSKKGLECPGYNRQLRWVNGVAARGHLRGQSVPTRPPRSEPLQAPALASHYPPGMNLERKDSDGGSIISSSGPGPVGFTKALGLDLPAPSMHFVDYYRSNLAGLMVWLDSEENDYRKRVVPLAQLVPAIGFAIMAFAAQHGATTFLHEDIATIAQGARDKCLQLIQHRAQEMTNRLIGGQDLNNDSDIADAEWMLASILIITNYENARCCPEVADEHRRAARTIVNLFKGSTAVESRELFAFLRNQLAIDGVLAATTSFNPSLIRDAITPGPGSDSLLFSKYLTFLHKITLTTIESADLTWPIHPGRDSLTLRMVQSEFEQARGATLIAAGKLGLERSSLTSDFIRLVGVYHNAGLLYSFRCLGCTNKDSAEWTTACNNLFDQLTGFEDQTAFIQNLPWPAFIAGTVSHGDEERQKTVLALFTAIHQATKFNHFLDAVSFLKDFWSGTNDDWRPLAKDREVSGKRIIVS
ncbi:uncharacterized protein CTRU02_212220 [Colletotrichum truncatum]|uniref:Uncharacterized protein n=1 Tax=Colletotrichum truncatum TaxID=5467 RepID=A0ACC3YPX2_COLTU|nr:uncharacterized protein CTRU02_06708 [Colletotrichum truncatum]KAF6792091.1 hypothetical protein CTRU02_06708 [Colletotrichum truncatum]